MTDSISGNTPEDIAHDELLDVCGLKCPHPILRTKKALATMKGGQIIKVISTDPATVRDFADFAKQTGNTICQTREEEGRFLFWLRRKD